MSPFEDEIDALYQLPLGDFVAARTALVKAARLTNRAAAQGIKSLAKPSVSAWAVNQLVRTSPADLTALARAGDAVRAAQTSGDDLADAMRARREAIAALMQSAVQALNEGGHGESQSNLRRISKTLEALASYGSATIDPPPGRLSVDIESPGFDIIAGLSLALAERRPLPPPPAPARRVTPVAPEPVRTQMHPEAQAERTPDPSGHAVPTPSAPLRIDAANDQDADRTAEAMRKRRQATVDDALRARRVIERRRDGARTALAESVANTAQTSRAVESAQSTLQLAIENHASARAQQQLAATSLDAREAELDVAEAQLAAAEAALDEPETP